MLLMASTASHRSFSDMSGDVQQYNPAASEIACSTSGENSMISGSACKPLYVLIWLQQHAKQACNVHAQASVRQYDSMRDIGVEDVGQFLGCETKKHGPQQTGCVCTAPRKVIACVPVRLPHADTVLYWGCIVKLTRGHHWGVAA